MQLFAKNKSFEIDIFQNYANLKNSFISSDSVGIKFW